MACLTKGWTKALWPRKAISVTMCATVNISRYGNQIGMATENALYTVGNTLLSAHNVTQLGPKAIAKRAVKDTANAVVNPKATSSSAPQTDIPTAMYPPNRGPVGYQSGRHTLEITEITSDDDLTQQSQQSNHKQ